MDGYVKKTATIEQTEVISKPKRTMKEYFAFTKLFAEMGDEYINQTLAPLS